MAARRGGTTGTGGTTAAGAGRRQEILSVAERLFWQKGFHASSMDDVADAIGLTKPAIYHYFRSKADILVELRQSIMDSMIELSEGVLEADGSPATKLRRILVAHCEMVLRRRKANKIYHEEQGTIADEQTRAMRRRESGYEDVLRGLYGEGVAAGELRDVDAGIAIATILGAINWSYRWFRPQGSLKAPQMAEVIVGLLLEGHMAEGHRSGLDTGMAGTVASAASTER